MSEQSASTSISPDAAGSEQVAASPAEPQDPNGGGNIRERWVEAISVALLAIASLAAAWCGYQANLWGGQQAAHYTQAGAQRAESIRATGIADRATQVDVALLIQWLDASQSGDQELADFYESRFSSEMQPAFDAWIVQDPMNNPDAPNAPFSMPEYVQAERERANQMENDAATLFEQGQSDNDIGDNYVLATVFLAATLFFLAVSTSLNWFWAQVGLTTVAGVMLVVALVFISTLGIA